MTMRRALRGPILHFLDDPGDEDRPREGSLGYFADGLLVIENGRIAALDDADTLLPTLHADTVLEHYPERLIMPGFIDAHLHFAQLGIIASYGRQLLDWLNNYTFPEESRFRDRDYADRIAEAFIDEQLRHGTTCAMVFATSHENSVEALFTAAKRYDMRLMTGKVLMDRNAPEALRDDPVKGIADSRRLLERWHDNGRLEYVLSPRFAPTSSPEQLAAAGRFLDDFPGIAMQTHLSENRAEIEWVASLYPEADDYLDVYARAGLLRSRCFFGHAIHIDDSVRRRLREADAAITVCPSSNLFLGSGLFDWRAARAQGVNLALATDIGAGTSLSQLQTLQDAYKVCQLNGYPLPVWQAFYRLTLGNARTLGIERHVGSFAPGNEADVVILDTAGTPLMARKRENRESRLDELLFDLMMLGDDRCVACTYVMGEPRYRRAD